jgi:hypothetical protein
MCFEICSNYVYPLSHYLCNSLFTFLKEFILTISLPELCVRAFLGAFEKLWKATFNFVIFLSVCLSVHMEKLGSHWTDFY